MINTGSLCKTLGVQILVVTSDNFFLLHCFFVFRQETIYRKVAFFFISFLVWKNSLKPLVTTHLYRWLSFELTVITCIGFSRNNHEDFPGIESLRNSAKTKLFLFSVPEIYLISLETPYFKFVRDSLSYIVLLVLHYALCLSPTTVTFNGLEWVILIFFIGRYLVEHKQIGDVFHHLKKQGDGGTQSKCIHLKALSMYQR